jgi:hypothetical protein
MLCGRVTKISLVIAGDPYARTPLMFFLYKLRLLPSRTSENGTLTSSLN